MNTTIQLYLNGITMHQTYMHAYTQLLQFLSIKVDFHNLLINQINTTTHFCNTQNVLCVSMLKNTLNKKLQSYRKGEIITNYVVIVTVNN